MKNLGQEMHNLCRQLFPICRSITGNGIRQSLKILQQHIPTMQIIEVPTGTKCFDWNVPKEWNITTAYIITPNGEKICDFNQCNLHVVGYSVPINEFMSLAELQKHLYSIPEKPDAIPYVTSYYQERWGFCLCDKQRQSLEKGQYQVVVESELKEGHLSYAELIIPGKSEKEIFLSTYLCHPSMANNELSGPVVTTYLAKWLNSLQNKKYTYRIIIIPETIGSITYLSRNFNEMKKNIIAGFNVTCIGDNRCYSYLASRQENTLADKVALHVLTNTHPDYVHYDFLARGSDERQYCSPGVDLPVCSITRTKFGAYPEYHTSLDNLSLISPEGLQGGYEALKSCLILLEHNVYYQIKVLCEPQLGKRGLYPTISDMTQDYTDVTIMKNFIAYCDGKHSLIDIADKINCYALDLLPLAQKLTKEGLLEQFDAPQIKID